MSEDPYASEECILEEDIDDTYDLANEDEEALLAGDEATQSNEEWKIESYEEQRNEEDVLVLSHSEALLDEEELGAVLSVHEDNANELDKDVWDIQDKNIAGDIEEETAIVSEEKPEESDEDEEEEEDTEGRGRFRQERSNLAPPRTQRHDIPDTLESVQVPQERGQFRGRYNQGRGRGRGHPRGAMMQLGMRPIPLQQQRQQQQMHHQQQHQQHLQHQQKPQQQRGPGQPPQQTSQQQQLRVAPFQRMEPGMPQPQPGPSRPTVPVKATQKILVNPHFKGKRTSGPDLSWLPPHLKNEFSASQQQQQQGIEINQQYQAQVHPPSQYPEDPYYSQPASYYQQQPSQYPLQQHPPPLQVQQHPTQIPPRPGPNSWGREAQYPPQYPSEAAPQQQHFGSAPAGPPPHNVSYQIRPPTPHVHLPPPQHPPPNLGVPDAWSNAPPPPHGQEYQYQSPEYRHPQPPPPRMIHPQPPRQPPPPGYDIRLPPPQFDPVHASQPSRYNFPPQPLMQQQYHQPAPYRAEPDYSIPPPNFQGPPNNYQAMEPPQVESGENWNSSVYPSEYYQQPPKPTVPPPLMRPPHPQHMQTGHLRLPGTMQNPPLRGSGMRGRGHAIRGRGGIIKSPMVTTAGRILNRSVASAAGKMVQRPNAPVIGLVNRTVIPKKNLTPQSPTKVSPGTNLKRVATSSVSSYESPTKQVKIEPSQPAQQIAPEEEEDEEMREYRKKIEEQKRIREAILKRKEAARRQKSLQQTQALGKSDVPVEQGSAIATLVNRHVVPLQPAVAKPNITQKADSPRIQNPIGIIRNIQTVSLQQGSQMLATRGRGRGVITATTKRKVIASLAVSAPTSSSVPTVPVVKPTVGRGVGRLVSSVVTRGRVAIHSRGQGVQRVIRQFQQQAVVGTKDLIVAANPQTPSQIAARGGKVAARGVVRKVVLGKTTAPAVTPVRAVQSGPDEKVMPGLGSKVVLVENLAASVTKERLMKLKGDLKLVDLSLFPNKRCAKFHFATGADALKFCKKVNRKMIDLSLITAKLDDQVS